MQVESNATGGAVGAVNSPAGRGPRPGSQGKGWRIVGRGND